MANSIKNQTTPFQDQSVILSKYVSEMCYKIARAQQNYQMENKNASPGVKILKKYFVGTH